MICRFHYKVQQKTLLGGRAAGAGHGPGTTPAKVRRRFNGEKLEII